jgi:protocatechuate 3,4-dioxygenase beta subunit
MLPPMPSPVSPSPTRRVRRREALASLGAVAGAAAWQAWRGPASLARAAAGPRTSSAAACVLSPEVTAGPYYVANHLTRRDITEGRPGLPLAMRLNVVDATSCAPIAGADVEVWHADALGVYSGYGAATPPGGGGGHATPTDTKTFLRGHQRSDAHGRVRFDTIYPGWYRGRAPHVHLEVHVGGSVVHTGQLFFSDPVSDAVYRTSSYRSHGQPDTTNANDGIYAAAGASRARLALTRHASGYVGTATLGVCR